MTRHDTSAPLRATLYALQNCTHCRALKQFLKEHRIPFKLINVDLLLGEQRSEAMRSLRQINPACSFPTVLIGQQVIVGFKQAELLRAWAVSAEGSE